MAESAQHTAKDVATLFSERQRYEAWIAALEAKRALTPPHIYTRVHADYTSRLQRVNEQLSRHRGRLREMETELMDRLTSLDIDEAKFKDEMAEADLRETVGELDAVGHREVLERTALGLAEVTGERLRASTELSNMRAMLGSDGEIGALEVDDAEPLTVSPTPVPPVAAAPPARRASKPVPAAPPPATEPDSWGLAPEDPLAMPVRGLRPDPPPSSSPFDDLEFLRSMIETRPSGDHGAVGNGAVGSTGTPPAAEPEPAPAAPLEIEAPVAAATRRPSRETPVAETPPAAAPPTTPPPMPAKVAKAPAPSAAEAAAAEVSFAGVAPTPAMSAPAVTTPVSKSSKIVNPSISMELEAVTRPRSSSDAMPSYLRDMPAEQVKTLKCQECGTLNYPTEWYCERCGAELAAL